MGSFGLIAGSEQLITAFESGIALYDPQLEPNPADIHWLARPQEGRAFQ